jgi:hypothetical protein
MLNPGNFNYLKVWFLKTKPLDGWFAGRNKMTVHKLTCVNYIV